MACTSRLKTDRPRKEGVVVSAITLTADRKAGVRANT